MFEELRQVKAKEVVRREWARLFSRQVKFVFGVVEQPAILAARAPAFEALFQAQLTFRCRRGGEKINQVGQASILQVDVLHKLVDGHGDLLLLGGTGRLVPVCPQQLRHAGHERDV
ncbi:hypothetical protein D3C85_1168570 [compost metagenome]